MSMTATLTHILSSPTLCKESGLLYDQFLTVKYQCNFSDETTISTIKEWMGNKASETLNNTEGLCCSVFNETIELKLSN